MTDGPNFHFDTSFAFELPTGLLTPTSEANAPHNFEHSGDGSSLTFTNECCVGGTWFTFKQIKSVQLDTQFATVFSLEWVEEVQFDIDPLITGAQLEFYHEKADWVERLNIWSQKNSPVIGEAYTWDDLHTDVELEPELLTWLTVNGLQFVVDIFTKKQCLNMASLSYLTDDLLQQWGLQEVLRRYILHCTQNM